MNGETEVKHRGQSDGQAATAPHGPVAPHAPWHWAAAVGRLLFTGPWSLGSDWSIPGSHELDRAPAAGGETWRWS